MDKDLLEKIYREFRTPLLLYIYSICRDYDLAEELMHETFVKAMLTLSDSHENFKGWLYTVGKNLTINRISRDRKIIYTNEEQDQSSDDDVIEELISEDRKKILYAIILKMPKKMKHVITLYYFSNLSFKK